MSRASRRGVRARAKGATASATKAQPCSCAKAKPSPAKAAIPIRAKGWAGVSLKAANSHAMSAKISTVMLKNTQPPKATDSTPKPASTKLDIKRSPKSPQRPPA